MFCPNCGTKNKKTAKFCVKCGDKLTGSAVEEVPRPSGLELKPDVVLDNRYRIQGIIEKGGMGAVYKALDLRLDNICAVKEMRENFEKDEYRIYAIDKFKSEALILSKLRHPNIPRVFDYFIENNRYYLVMDYISGQTLFKILKNRPGHRLEEKEVIGWTLQLCDVLSYLHSQDPPIIYRDIKPGNIMINEENRVMLIDFGIARIFNPKSKGTMIGTQGYAPPEQYRGQVDPRSDIYALGATLHHLITGKDPQDDAPFNFPPVKDLRKDISDHFAAIIDKCLKFNMDERFSSIEELREHLEAEKTPGKIRSRTVAPGKSAASKKKKTGKTTRQAVSRNVGLTSELEKLLFSIEGNTEKSDKDKLKEEKRKPVYPGTKKAFEIFPQKEPELKEEISPDMDMPEFEELMTQPDSQLESVIEITEDERDSDLFEKMLEKPAPSAEIPLRKQIRKFPGKLKTPKPGQLPRARPTIPFGPQEIKPKFKPTRKLKYAPKKKEMNQVEPEKSADEGITLEVLPGVPLEEGEAELKMPQRAGTTSIFEQAADTSIQEEDSPVRQKTVAPRPKAKRITDLTWAMFRGNRFHNGVNPKASHCNGNLKWRFHTNGRIYSSPTIGSDGTIYFGSDDSCLYALSAEGKEKWRFITDNSIHASPLLTTTGVICIGSEDNNFYIIDRAGREIARLKMGSAIYSSAVEARDGTIYVGCNDGNLYAITPDGKEKWRFAIDNFIYSSPAIGPYDTIYIGSWDKCIYAVSPEGKLKWKFKTGDIIDSSPAVDGAGCIYFGSNDNYVYALDHLGKPKWRFKTKDKVTSSPAIDKERGIFIGGEDNFLYNIDFNGELKWRFKANYWIKSSPILDGSGNIYVGSDDFSCYCINPEGEMVWKFKTNGSVETSPCISNRGLLFFGSNDGWLYALE